MPDPTLPARLVHRADAVAACAHRLADEVSRAPWRSTAADAMRAEANAVHADLVGAAGAVRDAASAVAVAQRTATSRAAAVVAEARRLSEEADGAARRAGALTRALSEGVVEAGRSVVGGAQAATQRAAELAHRAADLAPLAARGRALLDELR